MLLSEILNILAIYNNPSFGRLNLNGLTVLQKLEYEYVILHLNALVAKGKFEQRISKETNSVLNDDEEIWLKNFLESRWTRIQGTNSCYTVNEEIPANKICVALAKELADTLHIQQFMNLLMPTNNGITIIENNDTNEIQIKNIVTRKRYNSSTELKFLVSILSDEIGIKLFCEKAANFKYILKLDSESKELCINALYASDIGNNYLMKAIKSLHTDTKNSINLMVSQLKSKSEKEVTKTVEIKTELKFNSDNHNNRTQNIIILSDDEDDLQSDNDDIESPTISPKSKSKKSSKPHSNKKTKKTKNQQLQLEPSKKHSRGNEDILQNEYPLVQHKKIKLVPTPELIINNDFQVTESNNAQHLFSVKEESTENQNYFNGGFSKNDWNEQESVLIELDRFNTADVQEYSYENGMNNNNNSFSKDDDIEEEFELPLDAYDHSEDEQAQTMNDMIIENNPYDPVVQNIQLTLNDDLMRSTPSSEDRNLPQIIEKKSKKKSGKHITTFNNELSDDEDLFDVDEREINKKYNLAKKSLKAINVAYKKDEMEANLLYENNHTYSLAAEEKAAKAIKKRVMPLYTDIVDFYTHNKSFEHLLKKVKVSLEFIHEYPISKTIFNAEIAKIEECLNICDFIINSLDKNSLPYIQEAKDFKAIITTKHIPVLTYNYAILNHRQIKINYVADSNDIEVINKLIKALTLDIKNLKKTIKEYLKIKLDYAVVPIINKIKEYIAESYEDIADFKYKLLDLQSGQNNNTENSIQLLEKIKSKYQRSFKYCNKDEILLSILTCQYKLAELYLSVDTSNSKDKALLELNDMIDVISESDSDLPVVLSSPAEKIKIKLEILSSMLYACSKAYSLTKNDDFKTRALKYLEENKDFISGSKNAHNLEVVHSEIIDYLKELNFIENRPKWTPGKVFATLFNDNYVVPKNKIEPSTSSPLEKTPVSPVLEILPKQVEHFSVNLNKTTSPEKYELSNNTNSIFSKKSKPSSSEIGEKKTHEANSLEVNCTYEYESEDIQAILKARMKNFLSVDVIAAAQMNRNIRGNGIADVLDVFMNEQGNLLTEGNQDRMLLLPIQDAGHWVGLSVGMQGNKIVSLTYFNSYKNDKIDNHRMLSITSQLLTHGLITENMKVKPAGRAMQQCDGTSCGALLIENFYCSIKNQWWKKDDNDINDHDTKAIRKRHLAVIKDNDPEYYQKFNVRQSKNIISVPSLTIQQQNHGILGGGSGFFQTTNTKEKPVVKSKSTVSFGSS